MATALNATGGVRRRPHWTRTHAHLLVERVTCHSCALCMAQDVLGWKESASSFLYSLSSFLDVVVERPLSSFSHKSYPHLPAHCPGLQRPQTSMEGNCRENPCAAVGGLADWPAEPQNYRSMEAESCSGRGIVKDGSGAHAVFTEQGSSAFQIAAKVMDVIARLPGCGGQAADAVPAFLLR